MDEAAEDPDEGDERSMLAYAGGDTAAFVRLYDRHERPVHRFFLRQGAAPALADDLLQETWMAVIRSAPRYRADARFTTWLYRIARSKLVDHWRATRQHVLLDDAANDPDGDDPAIERIADSDAVRPDVQAMSRQHAALFVTAVEALPAAQREAFVLHFEGDLSMDEIATLTEVGVETAKSRLRYAMKRVRAACAGWRSSADDRARDGSGTHDDA
jgi:RNA polymerase sigma-70 factor (ECF subfamily)